MSEPVSTGYIAVTASGITIFGIITGLHPALMLAGAAGGWWAMSYQQQMTAWGRLNSILLSSIIAAWGSPVAAAWGVQALPSSFVVTQRALELVAALIIGLSAIEVLGRGILSVMRGLMSFFRKNTEKEGQ